MLLIESSLEWSSHRHSLQEGSLYLAIEYSLPISKLEKDITLKSENLAGRLGGSARDGRRSFYLQFANPMRRPFVNDLTGS